MTEHVEWVLQTLQPPVGYCGFFVELGAYDGLNSHTLHFERELGWQGVCIEPTQRAFKKLRVNRKCHTFRAFCGAESSGTTSMELQSTCSRAAWVGWKKKRKRALESNIPQRTLTDILLEANAPAVMDYLSLDVEGSEAEVLHSFDFDAYRFRCVIMEVNKPRVRKGFVPATEQLEAAGYVHVHTFSRNGAVVDYGYTHPDIHPGEGL